MTLAFIDRHPNANEIERFRLVLSTYQDGSGQQAMKDGRTIPGWRDFERSVALVFGGKAIENKYIFDVLIPDPKRKSVFFGLSCKMRGTLNVTQKIGRVVLELSNSSGKFWDRLGSIGIHQGNYREKPVQVARELLKQEKEWHESVGLERGEKIDLKRSYYLALSWNKSGEYQLFKFPLTLPDPEMLSWDFPVNEKRGKRNNGRRLRGSDERGTVLEWYGESGGQLKYYPMVSSALWKSKIFNLEPLPLGWEQKHGITKKAKDYFPEKWS